MPSIRHHHPLALLLAAVAIATLIGMLAVDLVGSRQIEIGEATHQIEQHDRMLAEHVARSFDSVEILLDEMRVSLQEGQGWRRWTPEVGHQRLKDRLSRSLPQVRHLLIFDAEGYQRYTSFAEAPPIINIRDRAYFQQLVGGAERSRSGPYIGRNSNLATYAIARRLSNPAGQFAGALMVAIEPVYFEAFCRSSRPYEEFEAAIVNAAGEIISICQSLPMETGKPPVAAGDDFRQVLAQGEFAALGLSMNRSILEGTNYLMATEPVPGYPDLRIVSTTPKALLAKEWKKHTKRILLLALASLIALTAAGLLIRRQIVRLADMATALQASHETLEARVQAATQELEQRRNEAERLGEAKSRFFAAASHDLRQPLHALQLFLADLSRLTNSPEQRVLVGRIEAATSAMTAQLRSLLDISRLDMANITPENKLVSLDEIFDQLSAVYFPTAQAGGTRLMFKPRSATLETDPALLIRLLGNLVDNAIKFSPRGSVLVCARWRANAVRIEVRDNGQGIPAALQQAVYDEFYQVGNQERSADAGLGLGLAIAHRVARLLGANISLRSAVGKGSTFALTLPCLVRHRQAKLETAAETSAAPRLILIGEPGDFVERARRWGYTIEVVANLAAAWRLMDTMPGIPVITQGDGQLLSGEIQSLLRQHPGIVITSAECDVPELGAYHLREPVKPARLRALLRSLH